jgi:cation:H+ antiporter
VTGFAFLAASAALLIAGAELFAENAAGAGRRLGVSFLAVGLILAGAEPEEFVTAVIAAARHHPSIGAGDAVGANVTMLTLVIGAACVITPMSFGTRLRGYAAAAAVTSGAAALTLLGGVSRAEGIGLVVLYLVVVAVIWRAERRPPPLGEAAELVADSGEDGAKEAGRSPALALLLVLTGIALMIAGGWLAVAGAERLTAALHLADSAVGLTFVALATVAELFALIWAAARRSIDELALAGVLGSALYNSTATLGATAIITPVPAAGLLAPAVAAAALPLVLIIVSPRRRLGRLAGVLLLAAYAAYVVITLHRP